MSTVQQCAQAAVALWEGPAQCREGVTVAVVGRETTATYAYLVQDAVSAVAGYYFVSLYTF